MSLVPQRDKVDKTDFVSAWDKVEKSPTLSEGQTNIYYYVIYILSAGDSGQKYY